MEGKVLIYFTSYSGDDFYMVTSKPDIKGMNAENFCKTFIPEEYNGWAEMNEPFKYGRFKKYKINEDGTCNILFEPCIGTSLPFQIREQDIIDTTKMEPDKKYFSDDMDVIDAFVECGVPY